MNYFILLDSTFFLSFLITFIVTFSFWKRRRDWKREEETKLLIKLNNSTRLLPKVMTQKTAKKYLVIGGHGCLGSHIVENLLARGETYITVFDAMESSIFEKEPFVTFYKGDIRQITDLIQACTDKDVVFQTAALVSYHSRLPHDYKASYDINVIGTKNVIEACRKCGVKQLIYTSSSHVVVDSKRNSIEAGDETLPYAEPPYLNHYIKTKVDAEKLALKANGEDLIVGIVRPAGAIWGPRDIFSSKFYIPTRDSNNYGAGTRYNLQDWNYVENIVHGELLLEDKLNTNPRLVSGKPYLITSDEILTYYEFWKKFSQVFNTNFFLLPGYIVIPLSYIVELLSKVSNGRFPTGDIAQLTPSVLFLSRKTIWFSCKNAKKDLGYKPIYTIEEGIERLKDFWDKVKKSSKISK